MLRRYLKERLPAAVFSDVMRVMPDELGMARNTFYKYLREPLEMRLHTWLKFQQVMLERFGTLVVPEDISQPWQPPRELPHSP